MTDIVNLKIVSQEEYDRLKKCEDAFIKGTKIVFTAHHGFPLAVITKDEAVESLTMMNNQLRERIKELESEIKRIKSLSWIEKIFVK